MTSQNTLFRLTATDHRELDNHLYDLLCDLSRDCPPSHHTIGQLATTIIASMTGKLIRPTWQTTWETLGCVVTGWFGDLARNEVAGALHAVFTEMVRLVLSATTSFRQQQYQRQVTVALCEYLSLRGLDISVAISDPSDGPLPPKSFRLAGWVFKDLTSCELQLLNLLWNGGKFGKQTMSDACDSVLVKRSRNPDAAVKRHKTALARKLCEQSESAVEIHQEAGYLWLEIHRHV